MLTHFNHSHNSNCNHSSCNNNNSKDKVNAYKWNPIVSYLVNSQREVNRKSMGVWLVNNNSNNSNKMLLKKSIIRIFLHKIVTIETYFRKLYHKDHMPNLLTILNQVQHPYKVRTKIHHKVITMGVQQLLL